MPKNKTDLQRLNAVATTNTIKEIVANIQTELDTNDWPYHTLAEMAGISVGTLHRLHMQDYKDSPMLSTVVKVCRVMGISVTTEKRKKVSFKLLKSA